MTNKIFKIFSYFSESRFIVAFTIKIFYSGICVLKTGNKLIL